MKIIKKLFVVFLFITGVWTSGLVCCASEQDDSVPYSLLNYGTEEIHTGEEPYTITDFYVTVNSVTLEKTGVSEFVDAKGVLEDGSIVDLSKYAYWDSSDVSIVIADQGRILAQNAGSATVQVSYGEYSDSISVTVLNTVDTLQLIEQMSISALAYGNEERIADLTRAANMINMIWTPTQNVTGWKGGKIFSAGVPYAGMPYSQTPNQMGSPEAFLSAMGNSDFYTVYTDASGRKMPRYGNDCSGFVSLSWNIGRYNTTGLKNGIISGQFPKVGSYNVSAPSTSDLISSYAFLVPGDAVVVGGSHTFMIAYNDIANQKVQCYEQTPYNAQVTEWTYSAMANGKYLPFTKK